MEIHSLLNLFKSMFSLHTCLKKSVSGKNNLMVFFQAFIVQDRWLCLPELP